VHDKAILCALLVLGQKCIEPQMCVPDLFGAKFSGHLDVIVDYRQLRPIGIKRYVRNYGIPFRGTIRHRKKIVVAPLLLGFDERTNVNPRDNVLQQAQ
jgi:hypothetical protein